MSNWVDLSPPEVNNYSDYHNHKAFSFRLYPHSDWRNFKVPDMGLQAMLTSEFSCLLAPFHLILLEYPNWEKATVLDLVCLYDFVIFSNNAIWTTLLSSFLCGMYQHTVWCFVMSSPSQKIKFLQHPFPSLCLLVVRY